jgi:hypothetical protein
MAQFVRSGYSVLALLCGCAGASSNSDAVRTVVAQPDEYCRAAPAALTDSAAVRLAAVVRAQASAVEKAQGVRATLPDADTFEELEASACLLQMRYISYHPAYISSDHFHAFVDSVAPAVLAEGATPEDRDFQKRIPRPVEPKDGATFDVYPRRTSVSWEPVPGATHYLLDVEVMTTIEESRQGRTVSSRRGWARVAGAHLRHGSSSQAVPLCSAGPASGAGGYARSTHAELRAERRSGVASSISSEPRPGSAAQQVGAGGRAAPVSVTCWMLHKYSRR